MNKSAVLYPLFLICLLAVCRVDAAGESGNMVTGAVIETMDSGGYTYVRIDTGNEKLWAAGPAAEIKTGDEVTISLDMPMAGYHSRSMDRDFDVLYFVGGFTQAHAGAGSQTEITPDRDIGIAEGGKSIAEIIDQHQQLANRQIKVRGQVVKFNPDILGRHWIHIRDSSGDRDLTITTNDEVTLGDVIVADGRIVLDKDFGYGYVYEIMMEDAAITIED